MLLLIEWYALAKSFVLQYRWMFILASLVLVVGCFTRWRLEFVIESPLIAKEKLDLDVDLSLAPAAGASEVSPKVEKMSLLSGVATEKFDPAGVTYQESEIKSFVKRFAKVAKQEQEKFGIPASLVLAMAIQNSKCGQSEAATAHFNFFLLPADASWPGETIILDRNNLRKYNSAWASFRDHSLVLYQWVQENGKLPPAGFGNWIATLERAKYTSAANIQALRLIVERYDLQEIDKLSL